MGRGRRPHPWFNDGDKRDRRGPGGASGAPRQPQVPLRGHPAQFAPCPPAPPRRRRVADHVCTVPPTSSPTLPLLRHQTSFTEGSHSRDHAPASCRRSARSRWRQHVAPIGFLPSGRAIFCRSDDFGKGMGAGSKSRRVAWRHLHGAPLRLLKADDG